MSSLPEKEANMEEKAITYREMAAKLSEIIHRDRSEKPLARKVATGRVIISRDLADCKVDLQQLASRQEVARMIESLPIIAELTRFGQLKLVTDCLDDITCVPLLDNYARTARRFRKNPGDFIVFPQQ